MLAILLFLLFFPLSIDSRRSIDFSLKPVQSIDNLAISILNEKWETIAKFANIFQNSTFRAKFNIDRNVEKVIIQLRNTNFSQNEILVGLKNENAGFIRMHTDDFKMKISTRNVEENAIFRHKNENGCHCEHGNCACCLKINIPEFQHSVCVNATYNPQTIGLDLSIGVDGHYFSEEISVRNPPPICFSLPIPGAEHIAGVCVAFENLDLDKKAKILSGCVEFEVELIHLRMLHFKIGCFRMPI